MPFTRALIHPATRIEYRGVVYDYNDLLDRIDRYHAVCDCYGITHGKKIAVHSPTSFDFYALTICAFERGVTMCVLPRKNLFVTLDEDDHDLVTLDTQYIFQTYPLAALKMWNLPIIDLSAADDVAPARPTIDAVASDNAITAVTSGTTGKPKRLFHTHSSIVAAVSLAKQFYTENDVVLIYSTVNHLGVVTVQFLPVLLAGCHIVLYETYLQGDSLLTAMDDQRLNKAIIFPFVLKPFYDSPRWLAIDMSHFDNIITGGVQLDSTFVDTLFKQGVKTVSSIYGLSEALPPVFVTTIDPVSRSGMAERDFRFLGKLVGDWTYQVKDGQLYLRGASLAQGDNIAAALHDGFLDTGDMVIEYDDQVEYVGRPRRVRREDGTLHDLNTIENRLNRHPEISFNVILCVENRLIAAIKYLHDQRLSLDQVNQFLEQQGGPPMDRVIDATGIHYRESAIKAIMKVSKELVGPHDGAP